MKRSTFRLGLAAAGFMLVAGACSVGPMLFSPATPTAAPTPRVLVVVATPTPGGSFASIDELELRRVQIYQKVAPAVVNITTQVLRSSFFWGMTPEEGSGSGFLWDLDGHIVTNYHVVKGANAIEVNFGRDFSQSASVIGTDPINDLAVLQVSSVPDGVQPLEIATSANLLVGQSAIVIGNPFGQFERTMTVGIISALNRTIETDSTVLRGVIQTDAAINRGNSGGPLLDSSGHLIGVNSAIFSPTGTSAGVGLAIPVDKVTQVVPALIQDGRFPHPWLGIEGLGYEVTPALANQLDLPATRGLLIARLYRDSPADRAGILSATQETIIGNRRYLIGGDLLTEIDGVAVSKWEDLSVYLEERTAVGQEVELTLLRGSREITLTATLQDTPASLQGS